MWIDRAHHRIGNWKRASGICSVASIRCLISIGDWRGSSEPAGHNLEAFVISLPLNVFGVRVFKDKHEQEPVSGDTILSFGPPLPSDPITNEFEKPDGADA